MDLIPNSRGAWPSPGEVTNPPIRGGTIREDGIKPHV
jgi:hypothetical protein